MSVKYSSKGGQLLLSISSVFTAIAATESIDGPDPAVETMKVPDLGSGVGIPKQPTNYVDSGTTSGTCYFDPADATHKAITAYLTAPALSNWKETFPDAAPTSWTWAAIVTKFKPSMKVGEFLKADYAMDNSGLVTGW